MIGTSIARLRARERTGVVALELASKLGQRQLDVEVVEADGEQLGEEELVPDEDEDENPRPLPDLDAASGTMIRRRIVK